MKFNLFKNDKTTARDEWILAGLILVSLVGGIALAVTAPSFWIIDSAVTQAFGVLWIVVAVMFLPSLIYRLLTNKREK